MANISDTVIRILGKEKNIQEAFKIITSMIEDGYLIIEEKKMLYKLFPEYKKEIETLDEISFKTAFGTMEISKLELVENDMLEILGAGRWCSPSMFFVLLCKKFNINLEYCDAESGCNFCYFIKMKNGKIVKEEETEYVSKPLIEYIFGGDIIDFIESYLIAVAENEEEVDEKIKKFLRENYGINSLKEFF